MGWSAPEAVTQKDVAILFFAATGLTTQRRVLLPPRRRENGQSETHGISQADITTTVAAIAAR